MIEKAAEINLDKISKELEKSKDIKSSLDYSSIYKKEISDIKSDFKVISKEKIELDYSSIYEQELKSEIPLSDELKENYINDGMSKKLADSCVEKSDGNIKIKTINSKLKDSFHSITGIKYNNEIVKDIDGKDLEKNAKKFEGVFPDFKSQFEVKLPETMLQNSDRAQFKICNERLKDEISKNFELRENFTEEQLEQIENEDTPDGFTWHHDGKEVGKMQLVDTNEHMLTAHTGGRAVWGGGQELR